QNQKATQDANVRVTARRQSGLKSPSPRTEPLSRLNGKNAAAQPRLGDPRIETGSRAGSAKGSAKYDAILRGAIKVFARNGFFNSKVADVAREAGVADGTVYLYFKNKDDILVSIFNDHMREALAQGRERLAELNDPLEKLKSVVYGHLEVFASDRDRA